MKNMQITTTAFSTIHIKRFNRSYFLSLIVILLAGNFAIAQGSQYTLQPQIINQASAIVDREYFEVEELYKQLHAHPELSFEEKETATEMARQLRKLGFEVTENVGGYGVVGVLKNGEGPTVLVRAAMDALPTKEETNLPYAS